MRARPPSFIELKLLNNQQCYVIPVIMSVEVFVDVQRLAAPLLRAILASACSPVTMWGGVGFIRSTVLITKGTKLGFTLLLLYLLVIPAYYRPKLLNQLPARSSKEGKTPGTYFCRLLVSK